MKNEKPTSMGYIAIHAVGGGFSQVNKSYDFAIKHKVFATCFESSYISYKSFVVMIAT